MSAADNIATILSSGARLTVPLAFAACGEYLAQRAGTLNISVEAMLLGAAFGSIAVASATGSATVGLAAGALVGVAVAFVHANLSHRLQINTFVIGLVLNALVLGLTSYLITVSSFTGHQVWLVDVPVLRDIPILGPLLFVQRWPVYLLLLVIPLTWWLVERSRWGLELRAVGENPQAADVSGIDVNRRRRQALLWCGLLAGLGGAYLAVGEVGSFNQNMTAGRGYLVIAAVIFGAWRLRRTLVGCVVFGLADAMRLALPALGVTMNSQLLIAAPYLLALLAMLVFATGHREPRALAQPFQRGVA
ncbi:ABC transporter permease [Micromonospora endophytica]|uniref:ABC transporter permease n=1 Tax=Micromonospora endophytica TaxID=515350 RepID=A0A2W2BNE2_9ACTN|nr:ABC transporter permease [Micromonospora endophytica]PZF86830.1 ABC transporter permease [Micromonospora endophytica]RIW43853.1 ABC transporter permease [Micromonospora endophytica]BCJ56976.1 ABC transporter permease [Micromonospora endophytica]